MDKIDWNKFLSINSGIIDSHAHLQKEFYADEQEIIIDNMIAANVRQIVNPGVDLKSIPELIDLAQRHNNIFIGLGLHPHQASEWDESAEKLIKNFITNDRVVAVGECGLDFFYNNSPREKQIFALQEQLKIARQFNKPVIIHCRDAWDELLTILTEHGEEVRGVLHCFTGDQSIVNRFRRFNFYISFSGILTFSRSTAIQEAAKIVDENRLLVETDCPFLAPHPLRGQRNEPAYVWFVAEKLAQLRNQSLAEIAAVSSRNARQLFALPEG